MLFLFVFQWIGFFYFPAEAKNDDRLGSQQLALSLLYMWHRQKQISMGCPIYFDFGEKVLQFRVWQGLELYVFADGHVNRLGAARPSSSTVALNLRGISLSAETY